MRFRINTFFSAIILTGALTAQALSQQPLRLEATIALPDVQGRIDHMSIDVAGKRLFVSALGNNTLEVIDLKTGRRARSVGGLSEPQGVLYVPGVKRIFVANANDGSVQLFDGTSFAPLKVIRFASDADNVRYDAASGHIYVGYGDGALAELDQDGNQIGEIKLDAHPESFQLEPDGPCIFVNLPDSRKIAVVDRRRRAVIANWHTGDPAANFPMALDEPHHRLYVVCRSPARLIVLDTTSGTVVATLPAVGDCDDAFYDAKRRRIYATGGEGAISVFHQQDPHHYTEMARIKTLAGARTGFFSPDFDRLYVAVRRHGSHSAAIRVYIPQP